MTITGLTPRGTRTASTADTGFEPNLEEGAGTAFGRDDVEGMGNAEPRAMRGVRP